MIIWWPQEYRHLLRGSNDQRVTLHRVGIGQRPGWQLDNGVGAKCNSDAPRLHGMPDADDASVAAHERDIDGESHKKGMNGTGRSDNQRMTLVEPVAPEQAGTAAGRIERTGQRMRQTPSRSAVNEYQGAALASQERSKESFLHLPHLLTPSTKWRFQF